MCNLQENWTSGDLCSIKTLLNRFREISDTLLEIFRPANFIQLSLTCIGHSPFLSLIYSLTFLACTECQIFKKPYSFTFLSHQPPPEETTLGILVNALRLAISAAVKVSPSARVVTARREIANPKATPVP
jgi:hypothetical protein